MFMGQFKRIRTEPSGAPMVDWVDEIPNQGLLRYLAIFNAERIIITSPKGLSEVLTTKSYDFQKPYHVRAGIGRILGVGVLLAEGDEHKFQRKHLMPAFAFRHVKDLYPVFWGKSKEAVQAMTAQIEKDAGQPKQEDLGKSPIANDQAVIEAQGWASRATLDIIGVAGMGRDFGAIASPDEELYQTYKKVLQPSGQSRFLGMLTLFLPITIVRAIPLKRNGEMEAAAATIRSVARKLIREKKEKLERKELYDVDILSVALESGIFNEEQLIDQMMTFLAAGHETTASAMTWAIYMLCRYPQVQSKLRAEIREKLPSLESDKQVTSMDIDKMPYLNAVCNEVLRYYPPVPLTLREAARDTTVLDQLIPKGTKIMLVPWAINKDRKLWGEDAKEFNPDRWLPEVSKSLHVANGGAASNYSFLTFLHGPRSCIGQAFSKAEFACLLAAWVGRLEFELNNLEEMDEKNMDIKGGITARPAKGLWVKARVVEGW